MLKTNPNQKKRSWMERTDFQSCGWGVGKMSRGRGQKIQTSSYKISSGDVTYGMVTIVKNTVLHI